MPRLGLCILIASLCLSARAADPWENDSSPELAIPISGNIKHEGRAIEPANDFDSYRFTVSGTATIVAETNRRPVDDDEEVRVSIYNSSIQLVETGGDNLAIDLGPGTWYVVLESEYGVQIPTYDVAISIYPHSPDRFESNNTFGQAKTLTRGVLHRFLNLTPTADEDWFILNPGLKGFGPSARTVIQATSTVRNLTFEVYDSGGNDETPFYFNQNELIMNLTAGNHYLRVLDYEGEGGVPNYTLTYWTAGGPDPYEDDDTPSTASAAQTKGANHTPSGHEQYRNVFPENDVDWIRFFVEDADNVQITAYGEYGPDPLLELYNAAGTTRLAGPDTNSLFYDSPADGYYLLRVRKDPGETFDPQNVYRFDIATIPIPRFTQGTLAGTVTSNNKQGAVNGAQIQILSPVSLSTTSASNGVYLIDALPQGAYTVRASAPGFQTKTSAIQVGGSVASLNFVLSEGPSTDLNNDGQVNAVDVQLVVNGALGAGPAADVNGDGSTNAVDVQLVINSALGV